LTLAILVLVRGDYEIQESKLRGILGEEPKLAAPDMVKERYGVSVGFLGPIGIEVDKIIADSSLNGIEGAVVGANEDDYHIVGVSIPGDVEVTEFRDIRCVKEGDRCYSCGGELLIVKAIEIGHIFKLGTRYSEKMGAFFSDRTGKLRPIVMGSYGIGLGRIMAAAVELYADKDGIVWPISISPFEVIVIDINPKETSPISEKIYRELLEKNVEVVLDSRDVRPGVKFKDADLIGFPIKIIVGEKTKRRIVDIKIRGEKETIEVNQKDIRGKVVEIVNGVRSKYAL